MPFLPASSDRYQHFPLLLHGRSATFIFRGTRARGNMNMKHPFT